MIAFMGPSERPLATLERRFIASELHTGRTHGSHTRVTHGSHTPMVALHAAASSHVFLVITGQIFVQTPWKQIIG